MSEPNTNTRRKVSVPALVAVLLLAVFGAWLLHPVLIGSTLRFAAANILKANDWTLINAVPEIRFGKPLRFTGVVLKKPSTGSRIDIASLDVSLNAPAAWFSRSPRVVGRVSLSGVEGFLAASSAPAPVIRALRDPIDPRWLPESVELGNVSLQVYDGDVVWTARDLNARFRERETGSLTAAELSVRTGDWRASAGPVSAATAWKGGTAWLGGMELKPGITIEELSANLLNPGGPAISLSTQVFGGSIRGDVILSSPMDAAFWISNVPLASIPDALGISARASGRIVDGRLTFRGTLARPADAEASTRLHAEHVRVNERGWDSLELGASLIHQRLVLSDFKLRQGDNTIAANGEVSLAQGWSNIAHAPFLLDMHADVPQLGSLARLAGGLLDGSSGRMSATASISGRNGEFDGFLSIEASDATLRQTPLRSLKMEAVFKKTEIEIAKLRIDSNEDFMDAQGSIRLASPHAYSGTVRAKINDLSRYAAALPSGIAGDPAPGGSVELNWQGDGSWKSHSGAFAVSVSKLVTGLTPAGINGDFNGTYSPQNTYFSKIALGSPSLHLEAQATFSDASLKISDLQLKDRSGTLLAEASASLPVSGLDLLAAVPLHVTASDHDMLAIARTRKPVSLASLLVLLGQKPSLDALMDGGLKCSGTPESPQLDLSLVLNRITSSRVSTGLPLSVSANARSDGSTLNASGIATFGKEQTAVLKVKAPFGLRPDPKGDMHWIARDSPIEAKAEFRKFEVGPLALFDSGIARLSGQLEGVISSNGTINEPNLNGRLEWQQGAVSLPSTLPAISNIAAIVTCLGHDITLDRLQGVTGGGTLDASGRVNLQEKTLDASLAANGVTLRNDAAARLRGQLNVKVSGPLSAAIVRGRLTLGDSWINPRIDAILAPGSESKSNPGLPPSIAWSVPAVVDRWPLDISVTSSHPVVLKGRLEDGTLVPDLKLEGTFGDPVLTGRIAVNNALLMINATRFRIASGFISFFPDAPWQPFLDLTATAELPGTRLTALAYGPANAGHVILRSEPPLPTARVLRMLSGGPDERYAPDMLGGGLPSKATKRLSINSARWEGLSETSPPSATSPRGLPEPIRLKTLNTSRWPADAVFDPAGLSLTWEYR